MKRLIRLATRIYPRAWRERYGEEFLALIDDAGIDGHTVMNVVSSAVRMQVVRWREMGTAAALALAGLFLSSWWAGQHPYTTPGTHQVFRQDSTMGAIVELVVIFAVAIGFVVSAVLRQDGKSHAAVRVRWACAATVVLYLAGVMLLSAITPRTIVSVSDSYCYDTWCIGIRQVNAIPQGQDILYTAEVTIFSDANRVPTSRPINFLYASDDHGRRFPLVQDSSSVPIDVAVSPEEQARTSLRFIAPASANMLYLAGDEVSMPWVTLYFGSDISPFHRRTLLRVR
jgi:hypothetical protein